MFGHCWITDKRIYTYIGYQHTLTTERCVVCGKTLQDHLKDLTE